jgi:hypothetical protein
MHTPTDAGAGHLRQNARRKTERAAALATFLGPRFAVIWGERRPRTTMPDVHLHAHTGSGDGDVRRLALLAVFVAAVAIVVSVLAP